MTPDATKAKAILVLKVGECQPVMSMKICWIILVGSQYAVFPSIAEPALKEKHTITKLTYGCFGKIMAMSIWNSRLPDT